jgi:hypothetical protein
MAATKSEAAAKLILKVETGQTSTGVPIYSSRTFANINPALTDDDVLAIGSALAGLQSRSLGSIHRQDTAKLVEA